MDDVVVSEELKNLTSLSDIEKSLSDLQLQEDLQNKSLNVLLDNESKLDSQMGDLNRMLPSLELVESDLENLCGTINFTSSLAETISSKVKLLDLAKSQVFQAIQRVDDILDLKFCTDGVKQALDDQDYEKAAANIYRYLCLDENVIKQSVNIGEESSSINASLEVLKYAREEMSSIVSKQFDLAVQSDNMNGVERFFKIFPMLKLEDEGLNKFSEYLSKEIAKSAGENLKQALEMEDSHSRSKFVFADIISMLFEGVARTIEKQQALVETYYGPGKLFILVKNIQKECDIQAEKLLKQFVRKRRLREISQNIQQSMFIGKRPDDCRSIDPRELEPLLNEIIVISSRAELYLRFIKRRVKADIDIVYATEELRVKPLQDFHVWIQSSELSRSVQEVIGYYIVVEEFYMRESISKAIQLDIFEEGGFTSSMTDDIFFILRQCIKRSMNSSSMDCVCGVLNHATGTLESDFKGLLLQHIKAGYPTGGVLDNISSAYTVMQSSFQQGKLASVDDQTKDMHLQFLSTMNNCEVASEHILALKNSLNTDIIKIFNQHLDPHKAKFDSCLSDLASLSIKFRNVLDMALTELSNSVLRPEIKPWISNFLSVSHNMSEDDLSYYEANDPWVQELICNLQSVLTKFKSSLLETIYDQLVSLVINEIAIQFEKIIFKSSFNRLGALFFDKELRSLIAYLTAATSWSVRARFARLMQVSTVLNLDAVSEISDYWGQNAGSLTWRLTPAEIRLILNLRIEFKADDIRKLKL